MGEVKQVSIKNWTYYFYNDMISLQNITKALIFTILDTLHLKKLVIVKIFTV